MRTIGIGLMAFFIAWAVFLLSSHNIPQRGLRQFNELAFGPQLVFEAETFNTSELGKNEKVFFGFTRNAPIILTGLPSYQSAAFPLPIDARPVSGYLQIDITSQVLDDVNGVLRISINNTKRGEMLLYPGEVGRSLLVPLLSEELAKERLVVSFSLLGEYETNSCTSKNGIQAIAEIEATSGLYLNLDRNIQTPRDQVLSRGRLISIHWDNKFSKREKNILTNYGTSFIRDGEKVIFKTSEAAGGLSIEELEILRTTLPRIKSNQQQWPYYVANSGVNFGVRRFYKSTSWRIKYKPSQFSGRTLPSAIDLSLMLSGLRQETNWMVSVTLNGSLIHTETLESQTSKYRRKILLNERSQIANNLIEVTLNSSENHDGICNNGPILIAQMEQDTVLLAGSERLDDQFHGLQNALKSVGEIGISGNENITDNQANLFAHILASALPETIDIGDTSGGAQIYFLERGQFDAVKNFQNEMFEQWILFQTDAGELSVSRLEDLSDNRSTDEISPNAVLIQLPIGGGEG
ncbi:hypothetical protein [Lentilitoribacter sp. EG35]|uniref:hypothetical protein n=1 Tax=Lentilitoribacter sp. EG35 TaxID=3234192 RepID=UPI00346102A9